MWFNYSTGSKNYEANRTALNNLASGVNLSSAGINDAKSNYSKVRGLASSAESAINNARSAANSALSSANSLSNVGAEALGFVKGVDANYDEALAATRAAAADIAGIRGAASSVIGQASELRPYATTLSGYGDSIWDSAGKTVASGLGAMDLASALMRLDGSGGGLAGEYARLYGMLSGDNQVSMAAADVQSSYQNAGDQAMRDLARRGVSPGSGASQSLRQMYARSLATALAAAKTRARKAAISDQASMLGDITAKANALLGTGASTYSAGLSGQNAAVAAKESAASVEKSIADIYQAGGSLYGTAASAQISQADEFRQIQSSIAAAKNAYLSTATSAYGASASAASSAGSILANAASAYSGIMNALTNASGNVVSAVNAYNSSKASVKSAQANASGEYLSTLAKRNDYNVRNNFAAPTYELGTNPIASAYA